MADSKTSLQPGCGVRWSRNSKRQHLQFLTSRKKMELPRIALPFMTVNQELGHTRSRSMSEIMSNGADREIDQLLSELEVAEAKDAEVSFL